MIELPSALAAWSPQLAQLPTDLAFALAPWLGRLSLAIGPLAASHRTGTGDPDGYAGLARRGSYERLVTTEWGVADLFPDEFLRRAAGGEHLFLELARREPKAALQSFALVSAGPEQLGSPRLAHLALMIVLARRAAVAGARFEWGVLEDPELRVEDYVDERGPRRLLSARTAISAGADAFAAWTQLRRTAASDVWFIGGEAEARRVAELGASCIAVRDVLEPGVRALDVEIIRRATRARLRLELPPRETCARLLRDPFDRRGSARPSPAPGSGVDVRFSPGGARLIIGLGNGSYETWPVPSSPAEQTGRPRRWTPPGGRAVVAVGVGRRSVLAVTVRHEHPNELELHYGNHLHSRIVLSELAASALSRDLARFATAPHASPVGTCALVRFSRQQPPDLILHVLGRLLVVEKLALLQRSGTTLTARLHPGSDGGRPIALAPAFFADTFVWGAQRELGQVHIDEAAATGVSRVAFVGARAVPELQFGFSLPQQDGWSVASVAWEEGRRRVVGPKLDARTLDSPHPVVGVCVRGGVPALLVRMAHRLAWQIGDQYEYLPRTNAPIASVAVCASRPNIAWVTEDGEVVVYSEEHHSVLLRRQPKAVV